jgi:hypothetical protein
MEENKNQDMCYVCNNHSSKCCGRFHHQYHVLRWVLIFIIMVMVFSVGVKIGEFKSMLGGEFGGYRHMRYEYGPVMYQTWDSAVPVSGAAVMSQPALKK